jgi:hypothetical protein
METLKTNGPVLTVSCEWYVNKELDDEYHQKCRTEIEAMAATLSEKWKDSLVPISTDQIKYRETWGCAENMCYSEGLADIPMQWKK